MYDFEFFLVGLAAIFIACLILGIIGLVDGIVYAVKQKKAEKERERYMYERVYSKLK